MFGSTAQPQSSTTRPRRRAIWVAGVGGLLLGVYAAAPWWLPSTWIMQRVSDELGRTLKRDVHIDGVQFNYRTGLTLEGLTIERRPGFGTQPFLTARHLSIPLTTHTWLRPFELLVGLVGLRSVDLGEVCIDELHCFLVINERGDLNIADLDEPQVIPWPAQALNLSRLAIHVVNRRDSAGDTPEPPGLRLPTLDCRIDRGLGRIRWNPARRTAGDGTAARIVTSGDLTTPRLNPHVVLGGRAALEWEQLPLQRISDLLPHAALEFLTGQSSGAVVADIGPEFDLDFTIDVHLEDAEVQFEDDRRWMPFKDTQLQARGTWDPHRPRLTVHTLHYAEPQTVVIDGPEDGQPAAVWEPAAAQPLTVSLVGSTQSLQALHRHLAAGFGSRVWPDLNTAGPCQLALGVASGAAEERYEVRIDATAAAVQVPGKLDLPAGQPKLASLVLTRHADHRWRTRHLDVTLGETALSIDGDWPGLSPDNGRPGLARSSHGTIAFQTPSVVDVLEHLPALRDLLPIAAGRGGLSFRQRLEPNGQGLKVSGELSMDADAELRWGPHLHKAAGKPLRVRYSGHQTGDATAALENIEFEIGYGKSRIRSLGGPSAVTLNSPVPSAWDRTHPQRRTLEASVHLGVEVSDLAEALSLWPSAEAVLQRGGWAAAGLDGECTAHLALNGGMFDGIPVVRMHLEVDAAALDLRLQDRLLKPRGVACRIDTDYRYDGRAPDEPQMAGMRIMVPGGTLELLSERLSDSPDAFHDLGMTVQIDDWSRVVASLPSLADGAPARTLGGGGRMSARLHRGQDQERWSGHVDLTQARFRFSDDPPDLKDPGTPLRITFEGRRIRHPADPNQTIVTIPSFDCVWGASRWRVDNLSASLAGLPWPMPLFTPLSDPAAAAAVALVELDGRAEVRIDPPAATPVMRDLKTAVQLRGPLTGTVQVSYRQPEWIIEGRAAALLGSAAADAAQPSPDLPAELTGSGRINLRDAQAALRWSDCVLTVGGLAARCSGRAQWDANPLHPPTQADLNLHLDVADVAQIVNAWPGGSPMHLAGGLTADSDWRFGEHGWRLQHARSTFDPVRFDLDGLSGSLHGTVTLDPLHWSSDALDVQLGRHRVSLGGSGRPRDADNPLALWARVDDLDVAQLVSDARQLLARLPPPWTVEPQRLTTLADVRQLLRDLHLQAGVTMNTCTWRDARGRTQRLDEVVSNLNCTQGTLDWQVRSAFEGGLLQARLASSAAGTTLEYDINGCLPSPHIRTMLRQAFPGIIPSGTIDYSRHPGGPATDGSPDPQPIESGELIIHGGTLRGKAAPDWVTTLFPRLNLASFQFDTMHDWYGVLPDGRTRHEAVFIGQYYHLYASGAEQPDGAVHFEIGIDLLGGLDSQYWTRAGSGRIPLFVTSSRVGDDGALLQEAVEYKPLELVKALLWGTNPIHTAYLALRKRISETDGAPDPGPTLRD